MNSFKFFVFLIPFFLTNNSFASQRKISFNIPTINTEYIAIDEEFNRSRRKSSIFSQEQIDSIQFSNVHEVLTPTRKTVLSLLIESGVNLNSDSTINLIRNNNSFRRDNLNTHSNRYYVIDVGPSKGSDQVYKLIEVDNSTEGTIKKELSIDEINNIPVIVEEIIYNTILYELPSLFVSNNTSSVTKQLDSRFKNAIGVSAGDDSNQVYSLWVKGVNGLSKQLKTKEIDAFKSRNYSGIIGFDLLTSDTSIVGLAYQLNKSTIKFLASSTKENTNSHTVSMYVGSWEHSINLLHSVSFGRIFVNNFRNMFYNNEIVTSKHKGKSVSFNTTASKKYSLNNNFISPKLSLDYSYLHLDPFKENGVVISKAIEKKFSVSPTVAVSREFAYKNLIVIPSIHYSLLVHPIYKQKRPHITILHNSQSLYAKPKGYKIASHIIGTELSFLGKNLNASCSYDFQFERKNKTHMGNVGLKWQF